MKQASAWLALALVACGASITLHDAGLEHAHDTERAGWSLLSSARYGVAFALPGTPVVDEIIDDPGLDHEGVELLVRLDPELRRAYAVRILLTQHDGSDAARTLRFWREELFVAARGDLEREEALELSGHPGIVLHYAGVGPRHDDDVWTLAVTDGRTVLEVAMTNPEHDDEDPRPADVERIGASVRFGQ